MARRRSGVPPDVPSTAPGRGRRPRATTLAHAAAAFVLGVSVLGVSIGQAVSAEAPAPKAAPTPAPKAAPTPAPKAAPTPAPKAAPAPPKAAPAPSASAPPAPAAQAPPPAPPPPYEPQLLRLAEMMGALAYLRDLCGEGDSADFRAKMAALIDAESLDAQRRDLLAGAYNKGFRDYAASYRICGPAANAVIERYLNETARLAADLASRYGG